MKVYRYLSEKELNNILQGNTGQIGGFYANKRFNIMGNKTKVNNHRYNPKERYLHFYKNISDIEHIRNELKLFEGNFYFAEFEVPALVLFFAAGKGYYNTMHGYDYFFESIKEYAVKVKNFNPNWLMSYTMDKDKKAFMHEEDYYKLKFTEQPNKGK